MEKNLFCLMFFILVFLGISLKSDKNAVESLLNVNEVLDRYHNASVEVAKNIGTTNFLIFKELRVYNKAVDQYGGIGNNFIKFLCNLGIQPMPSPERKKIISVLHTVKPNVIPVKSEYPAEVRDLDTAFNNISFRLFIWQDMLDKFYEEKPLLGFDFGYPFRSKRLETLNWGRQAWGTDGWIAAHNSYFEIIFRFGLIGILFILAIFILLFKMIRISITGKSFVGIFLCGIPSSSNSLVIRP